MTETIAHTTVLIVYASLVTELVFFPVPSIASTFRLLNPKEVTGSPEGIRRRIADMSLVKKILILLVPSLAGGAAFCIPLALILRPELSEYLFSAASLEKDILRLPGVMLMAVGRVITISAAVSLRKAGRTGTPGEQLITDGIFSRSRNPVTLGLLVTFLGMLLLFPSLVLLCGFLIFAASMHIRILVEEDMLQYTFGNVYVRYLSSTGRYL